MSAERMRWFVLSLAAVLGSGCSLLVQFDPESQPCDSANQCLAGYLCSDAGLCKASDAGMVVDAGGTDASTCTTRETLCGDSNDNDCDGQRDCLDTDCMGQACDDRDLCTTGETCSGGTCLRGTAVVCNPSTNPCQAAAGSCEPLTGRCAYAALTDGTNCGAGQASRCCLGTCVNTAVNTSNCGGCGLQCAMAQTCQAIDQSGCFGEPINTSGRCGCGVGMPCPNMQVCSNGRCAPATANECAPGQSIADAGTCASFCRY